ncbi:MAG TPA: hypothetical protein VGL61_18730 [Kofleriaceae bacterium]
MGDELATRIAAATSEDDKYALIKGLRPPFSDELLAVLANALADQRRVLISPGWYDDRDSVANAARIALECAGERIEPVVAAKLDHDDRTCRDLALGLLAALPALAPATLDAILRLAGDPRHAYKAGLALAGKLDARPLLDFPETRLAGLIATPGLEPAWLVELFGDANHEVRLRALHRVKDIAPPAHELAPAIVPLLADPDPVISAAAIRAIAPLRTDDASVTAAMFAAIRDHGRARELLDALAKRPPAQLVPFVPEMLRWLRVGDTTVAVVLGALGSAAPENAAVALGDELVRRQDGHFWLVRALEQLGAAALPALPSIDRAARELADGDARTAVAQLAARLHALAGT